MAGRVGRIIDAAARAAGVSRATVPSAPAYYQGTAWPADQFELDYPRAAALVPVVYGTITSLANDSAMVAPKFYRRQSNGKRVLIERERDNIVDVLWRANPQQSGFELERDRQGTLDTSGHGYLYIETFGRRGVAPTELYVLPGHLLRPHIGPRRTIEYYEWCYDAQAERLDPETVIPFHYWNPNWNPLAPSPEGLSPLSAARLSYEAGHSMKAWQREWYRGGGRVAHIFAKKNDAPLNEGEIKQMRAQLEAQAMGIKNISAPVFVRGVEVHKAGLSLADMKFLETSGMSDGDVREVYGVPRDGVTKDSALQYAERALAPRFALRDAVYNEWLVPLFYPDGSVECRTDISELPAVQSAMLEMAKAVVILVGRPILTPNEGRLRVGLDETDAEGADELHNPDDFSGVLPGEAPTATPGTEDGTKPQAPGVADEQTAEGRKTQAVRASLDIEARRRRADMNLRRYERRLERWAMASLSAQEARVLERAREQAERTGMDTAMRFALDADSLWDDMDADERAASLQREFTDLMRDRGDEAAAQVGRELAIRDWLRRLEAMIRTKAARAVTQIDETTRVALRQTIVEGLASGDSYSAMVARIRSVFDDRRANVQTIARTETAWAYNAAALEAWHEVGVTGKSWLTMQDDVVRDSCRECEAAGVIPMTDAFPTGLMFPGDPSALDASLVCNCRCTLEADESTVFASKPRGLDHLMAGTNGHANGVVNRLRHLLGVGR